MHAPNSATDSVSVFDVSRANSTFSSPYCRRSTLRRRQFCHCPKRRPFCTAVRNPRRTARPFSAARYTRGAGKLTSPKDGRPFAHMIDANGCLYLRRTSGVNDADKPARRWPTRPRCDACQRKSRVGSVAKTGPRRSVNHVRAQSPQLTATSGFSSPIAHRRAASVGHPRAVERRDFFVVFRAASCRGCTGRRSGLHFIECLSAYRRF
jgi:hypothetical protein